MFSPRLGILLLVLCLVLFWRVDAQTSTGAISITALDGSGAVVPRAGVTVTGAETGNTLRSLQTNDRGLAAVPLVPPGRYDITISSTGFKKVLLRGVSVDAGQTVDLQMVLEPGAASESVTVTADAPLVEDKSGTLNQVITGAQILSLPLNGRNYLNLANLTPGTVPSVGSRDQTFSAYGNTGLQNAFLLDGARNENYLRGLDNRARDMLRPPLDALNEVTIQTSNYSAQFGAAAGGVVNAITKSGTNQIHGSAYDFLRNSRLDAANYFALAGRKPLLVQNQYGGSMGGPLIKNRAWLFGAYEGFHNRSEQTNVSTVPTVSQRNGDFGSTPIYDPSSTMPNPNGSGYVRGQFPGNVIPASAINPIGQQLIHSYPLANVPGSSSLFSYNSPQLQSTKNGVVRGVVQLTSRDSMFARYSIYRITVDASAALPPPAQTPVARTINSAGVGYGYTRTFGPTLVNEARFSWTAIDLSQDATLPLNEIIPGALDPVIKSSIPAFNVSGVAGIGAQPGCCGNDPLHKTSGVWDVSDNVTKSVGAHLLKFGADFMLIRPATFAALNGRGSFGFSGVFTQNPQSRSGTGSAIADLLLGSANSLTSGTAAQAVERGWYAGEYFQDEWTVNQRLTLNIGLRYELFAPYIETDNRMANFVLDSADPLFGQLILSGDPRKPRSLITMDKNNFAPRFSFAYRVPHARDFIVRGSFGIFYGQDEGNGVSIRMTSNPPFYGYGATSITSDQLFPSSGFVLNANARVPRPPAINAAGFKLTPTATSNLVSWAERATTPYVEEWNLTVEKALPWNIVWQVNYVGNVGIHVWGSYAGNQPLTNGPGSITTRRPLAQYTVAPITAYSPWNRTSYQGTSTKLEKRFSTGVSFLSSFTFGHAIDYQDPALDVCDGCGGNGVQNSYHRNSQRGSAENDVRARFTFGGLWELPFGKGKPWLSSGIGATAAGGWQLSGIYQAQTGSPYTPVLSFDNANAGNTSYPNRICSGNLQNPALSRYFDTSCFVAPASYQFGNSGRNILYGPGWNNIDFSLHREFPLPFEHARLEFRAEAFNAVNHPQFANPGATVGTSTYGVITATSLPNRQLQFALRASF